MPLLKTTSGNVVLRNQSGQVRVFHCPQRGGKGTTESFLDAASKAGTTASVVRRVGSMSLSPSVPGLNPKIVGQFCQQLFDIEEGEIVKVFVDCRNNYGKRPTRASIYLRLRATAATRLIRFKVTDHPSSAFQHGEIEGNFDILTLNEVEAAGVKVLAQFRSFCSDAVVQRAISEQIEISPEVTPAQRVTKVEVKDERGETKEMFVAARPRRVIGS